MSISNVFLFGTITVWLSIIQILANVFLAGLIFFIGAGCSASSVTVLSVVCAPALILNPSNKPSPAALTKHPFIRLIDFIFKVLRSLIIGCLITDPIQYLLNIRSL